jgi:1-acyl-sn-glycerol-3-phosphate acyltransferase
MLQPSSRDRLVGAVLEFLVSHDLVAAPDVRTELERQVDAAGPDAVIALKARLTADNGWGYYPPDPLAQEIHHRLAGRFLADGSDLRGADHLIGLAGKPVVLFSNHLSYADANVIEVLLHRFGAAEIGDRLTALAGPKVFTSRERRFSSLCFGTVKVPQSAEVSTEEAVLSPREVARAARRAIDAALERLRAGDALLLFAEGTRSRTSAMHPMLPGVVRYLAVPGTMVVPIGLTGPERLFSVEDSKLRPARIVIQIGRPIEAETLLAHAGGDRSLVIHAIGLAIDELVPVPYRGAYSNPDAFADASGVLQDSRRTA